jgi:hypothetical protein
LSSNSAMTGLPVGVRKHKYGGPNATCPKCIQPEKVRHYLYLCHSRTNWRDQFIDKLTKHLKDASTAADLRCSIVEGIQKWFRTDDTNEPDAPDPTTQLGWDQVIKGYLPNKWSVTQEQNFPRPRTRHRRTMDETPYYIPLDARPYTLERSMHNRTRPC